VSEPLSPGTPSPTPIRLVALEDIDPEFAVDYHMHTSHTDGTASSRQMAESAASAGINEILFSEHVRHTSTYYPTFVDEIGCLRDSLEDLGMGIKVGIETKIMDTDGFLDCSEQIASLCDAIVGSVHRPPSDDQGNGRDWSDLDEPSALDLEFQLAMAIVTKSKAHILGHPMGMMVTRFNLQPLEHLYELACACRTFDKAFELNTRYCASPKDWIDVVSRAGCKVSFGSDAHRTADVGSAWHLFAKDRTTGS
jgi:histidinol phosphatase-like PHP family hydrolase